jgi:hypothetical protein
MLLEELRDKIKGDAIHLAPQYASRLFIIQVGFLVASNTTYSNMVLPTVLNGIRDHCARGIAL